MKILKASLFLVSCFGSWLTPKSEPLVPNSPFDQYGTISWEDEKARLDNFAIQLQNWKDHTGYILVVEAVDGCPGEAQARAIRAKRYIVQHRGIPTNRLIWRIEGYREQLITTLLLAPRDYALSHGYGSTMSGKSGPLDRSCKLNLTRIRKSRW